MQRTATPFALTFLLALASTGCGDDATPVGENDALAMRACSARMETATPLTAASSPDLAGEAVVHPHTAYAIEVSGTGYVTFRSDVEHHDWALFTRGADQLEVDGLMIQAAVQSGCDTQLNDHRVHVHAAQDFVMTLRGQGILWLYAVRSASDHTMMDGGHTHDGGHEHHDGGHAHDGGHDHGDAGVAQDGGHEGDGGHTHDGGHHGHDH